MSIRIIVIGQKAVRIEPENCVPLVRLALDLDTEPKFESLTYVLRPTDKQADRHEDLCL